MYNKKQASNANPKKATKPLLPSFKDGTTSCHKKLTNNLLSTRTKEKVSGLRRNLTGHRMMMYGFILSHIKIFIVHSLLIAFAGTYHKHTIQQDDSRY
jgi:hypothetical protein